MRAIPLALAGLALAGSALVIAAPRQQVFRSTTDLVTIDVSVRTGNRPVTGLTAADFQVLDNGVAQTVDSVAVESMPIDMTLVLDVSSSVEGKMLDRLKASVRDTERALRPDDQLRLIEVHQSVHELFALQPASAKPSVDGLTARGSTSLYDGLALALMRTTTPDRRQVVVVFTDGHDTSSIVSRATAVDTARVADPVLHVVMPVENLRYNELGPRAVGDARVTEALSDSISQDSRRAEALRDAEALRQITAQTGGQMFVIDLDASIGDAFKRALEDFRTSYVLRYSARGVTRAGWHDLTVRVVKSGRYDVRARRGYLGGLE